MIVGAIGMVAGAALGRLLSVGLGQIHAAGSADPNQKLMISQSWWIYGSASVLALIAAVARHGCRHAGPPASTRWR